MLKFLVADAHPLFREALITVLQDNFDKARCFESDSLASAEALLNKHRTMSIILLDINMSDFDNFYGLLRIRQRFPDVPVAVISAAESVNIISKAIECGAVGYIPKTTKTTEIIDAIKVVVSGDKWLPKTHKDSASKAHESILDAAEQLKRITPKQFRVLRLVRKGLMNKQVAQELNVSEATVKAHISSIFKQFNVKSRTQMLIKIEKLQLE